MVQPFWKTVWQFLKRLNIVLSYNPAIPGPIPDVYREELKAGAQTKT